MSGNPEIPDYIKKLQKTWEEYKEVHDSQAAETAEGKEKIEKLEKQFDKLEEVNQKITADSHKEKAEREELKEQMKELEKKLFRMPGAAGGDPERTAEEKAFLDYMKNGQNMKAENRKILLANHKQYMRTDNNPDGGFLAPVEWSSEIERNMTEISALRPFSRVITIGAKSWFQPVRTELLGSAMTAEAQALVASISQYGGIEIFVKKITAKVPVTAEALEDAQYNLESEIRRDIQEEFDRKEGQQMVSGDGVNEMKGFMNNPLVASVNSTVADDIKADALIDLTGELKSGYRPIFAFNRKTLARIRKFKDGAGAYIWTPSGTNGLDPGVPNEINGYQYIIVPDMPDIAADAYPIIYGDFRKFYIVDRIGITLLRDVFTGSDDDKVVFKSRKRTGCDIVLPEAFVKMKCAV